jgi:hypothetical protein
VGETPVELLGFVFDVGWVVVAASGVGGVPVKPSTDGRSQKSIHRTFVHEEFGTGNPLMPDSAQNEIDLGSLAGLRLTPANALGQRLHFGFEPSAVHLTVNSVTPHDGAADICGVIRNPAPIPADRRSTTNQCRVSNGEVVSA